jgi:tRNA (adenine-N(1)-)-methyltransferase non-catalytic subunit
MSTIAAAAVVPEEGRTNGQSVGPGAGGEWETKKRKLDEKSVERNRRRAERREEEAKARISLQLRNLDSFILMTRNFDPCLPAQILIEFLAPSAPFAIFSPIIEPLAQCMVLLKNRAVNLRLSDTWLRRYQILKGRTRPDMNMSGSGGFILTGTKIV